MSEALPRSHAAAIADALARLTNMPHEPVEPDRIALSAADALALAVVDAPGAVSAEFVSLNWAAYARTDSLVRLCTFTVAEAYFSLNGPDLRGVGVANLASLVNVIATLQVGSDDVGRARAPLRVLLVPDLLGRRTVSAFVHIPASARASDLVVGSQITLAGSPLACAQPLSCRVFQGVATPQRHSDIGEPYWRAPSFSRWGVLYVPQMQCDVLPRFGPDGAPLAPISLAASGGSSSCVAAAVADDAGLLLIGEEIPDGRLSALDLDSGELRWAAPDFKECCGVAVLPDHGVAIASSYKQNSLHVHRLTDGVRVASQSVDYPMQVAADLATGTVYVSTSCNTVSAYCWRDGALDRVDFVDPALGELRFVAVVPAAGAGVISGHLVVGKRNSGNLLVFALPGGDLIHEHYLANIYVMGLAGDPGGAALAVCDARGRVVEVLSWPLPGMQE